MARKFFSTLIPLGFETPLRADVLSPAAEVLADGSVALFYRPGAEADLFVQRFSQTGRPLADPVDLGPLDNPAGGGAVGRLAALEGGGVAVAWTESFSQATTSHYAVIDAEGELVAREDFNTSGLTSGLGVTGLPDGGFALVEARTGFFSESAVLTFQRFTAEGAPVGEPLDLAQQSGPAGSLSYTDPQALAVDDGVQLLWIAREGVRAALVGDDDTVSGERLISGGTAFDLDAARLADGRVVATWAEPSGDDAFVMAAVFDPARPDQAPVEIQVGSADVLPFGADPEVVALRSGGWAISWHDGATDGSTTARTWGRTGDASPEFRAHGDFFGVDDRGRVLSSRVDADGDVFLARYAELSLPFFIPGLDRIPFQRPDLDTAQAAQDWLV